MFSINMRIFKTVLLMACFVASIRCLPTGEQSTRWRFEDSRSAPSTTIETTAGPASTRLDTNYYDQRQNGSENYRIHVDGVVLVFAPAEAFLLAGATSTTEPGLSSFPHDGSLAQTDSPGQLNKPNVPNKTESASSKTLYRHVIGLPNFLAPILRHLHHERGASVQQDAR